MVVHVDDILVMGNTNEEHDRNLDEVLKRIHEAGMTLNEEKCKLNREEVEFLGFRIGKFGIKAGPKIQGIIDYPKPNDIKGVRSFLGMVNQFARFTPNIAKLSVALKELLHKNIHWTWNEAQQMSFTKLKEKLMITVTLNYFDATKKTVLTTDASEYGIGAVLSQQSEDGTRKMIGAASRSLTETERRYAVIEKVALGVVWGLEKFNYYISGAPILVETDHKPLIALLECKEIEKWPLRIQLFRIRLMKYSVDMTHISGKDNLIADALSRYPGKGKIEESILQIEVEHFATNTFIPGESQKIRYMINLQEIDTEIKVLKEMVLHGWKTNGLSNTLNKYKNSHHYLSIIEGCLTYQNRAVIPLKNQKEILDELHVGHQGISKCIARAKNTVFWFGITKDIENLIRECTECKINARENREPLQMVPVPSAP